MSTYVKNLLPDVRRYLFEPIIGQLFTLFVLVSLISAIVIFAELYVKNHYEIPYQLQLQNLKSKEKLAQIINRDLLRVNTEYRRMLLTRNPKQRTLLFNRINYLLKHTHDVIDVLKFGGTVVDVQQVNFYDKNEIGRLNIKKK